MAAQPNRPETLEEILERHYARLVMATETRNEGLSYVIRVMQRDIETLRGQVGEIAETQKQMGTQITEMRAQITEMLAQIAEIAGFQKTMMQTFSAFATDVMKQILALQQQSNTSQQQTLQILRHVETLGQEMRDGFAAQAERHNELMLRVERLERREPPRQERE